MHDVLLWDFGDTLVDERWMLAPPVGISGWRDAWIAVMATHADDWNRGAVSAHDVFAALADETGMTAAAVEVHAHACCRTLGFHEHAWRVAREHRLPQALVTVNPDIFGAWIVPDHRLHEVFDAIVMSYAEGTTDKCSLCDRALERLGATRDRSRALLIDNRADLVEQWRAAGGVGYWFRDDEQFHADLAALLARPPGRNYRRRA